MFMWDSSSLQQTFPGPLNLKAMQTSLESLERETLGQ